MPEKQCTPLARAEAKWLGRAVRFGVGEYGRWLAGAHPEAAEEAVVVGVRVGGGPPSVEELLGIPPDAVWLRLAGCRGWSVAANYRLVNPNEERGRP